MEKVEIERYYHLANERATTRHTDMNSLLEESMQGYHWGLQIACGGDIPPGMLERIKSEDNFSFGFVCGVRARLEAVKGKIYKASWQRRGTPGIMSNLFRKMDRLDAIEGGDMEGAEYGVTTRADLAVYADKWVCFNGETNPEEFLRWINEVRAL